MALLSISSQCSVSFYAVSFERFILSRFQLVLVLKSMNFIPFESKFLTYNSIKHPNPSLRLSLVSHVPLITFPQKLFSSNIPLIFLFYCHFPLSFNVQNQLFHIIHFHFRIDCNFYSHISIIIQLQN